jgi:hypothetical protein
VRAEARHLHSAGKGIDRTVEQCLLEVGEGEQVAVGGVELGRHRLDTSDHMASMMVLKVGLGRIARSASASSGR